MSNSSTIIGGGGMNHHPITTLESSGSSSKITCIAVMKRKNVTLVFGGNMDKNIMTWEIIPRWIHLQTLEGHTRSIISLLVSNDNNTLVSSSSDGTIKIWKVNDDNNSSISINCTRTVSTIPNILSMTCIFDTTLVLAGQSMSLDFINIITNNNPPLKSDTKSMHHCGYIYALTSYYETSNNDKKTAVIVTGSSDLCVKEWTVEKTSNKVELHRTLTGHTGSVLCLFVTQSSTDRKIFSGSQDCTVRCYNNNDSTSSVQLSGHDAPVLSLTSERQQNLLLSASKDSEIFVWDINTLRVLYKFSTGINSSTSMVMTSDSDKFIFTSSSSSSSLTVWPMITTNKSNHRDLNPFMTTNSDNDDDDTVMLISYLSTFVSFKSVSSNNSSDLKNECWNAALFLKNILVSLGCTDTELIHNNSHNPVVTGRLCTNAQNPWVLVTGHYDVQPAGPNWDSDPFTLSGRQEYVYGRGTTDDKGPILVTLFAIRDLLVRNNTVSLPNFIFMYQGEGESSSKGFQHILQTYDLPKQVDLVFISNNYWIDDETPCLTFGMRGCIELKVTISGPKSDVHAGVDGGVLQSEPMSDLISLCHLAILSLNTNDHSSVRAVSEEECLMYDDIEFDIESYKKNAIGTDTSLLQECCRNNTRGESLKSRILMDRWRFPSTSITTVSTSISNKSIIPKDVSCIVSVRTVPDQDGDVVAQELEEKLRTTFSTLKSNNTLTLEVVSNTPWWLADVKSKYYVKAAAAIEKHWKKKPFFVREGGSSANTRFLSDLVTKNGSVLHFPLGQASDGGHLQNERIRLLNLSTGRAVLRDFFASIV